MASGKTSELVYFSQAKAQFRKYAPQDPITGAWSRAINRVVDPRETQPRDRSLNGKARIKARKAANKKELVNVSAQ